MARIVQSLTQQGREYDQLQLSFSRDIDGIVQKLNTTFQQDVKDEVEAFNFFLS
jgi:formiminotetrahydrofolate cyclodeaminase